MYAFLRGVAIDPNTRDQKSRCHDRRRLCPQNANRAKIGFVGGTLVAFRISRLRPFLNSSDSTGTALLSTGTWRIDSGRVVFSLMRVLSDIPEWATRCAAVVLCQMPVRQIQRPSFGRSPNQFFDQRHAILFSVALHVAKTRDVTFSDLVP